MADKKLNTVQENIAKANYEQRQADIAATGGGVVQSPLQAKSLGASPDQAKMVGSQPASLEEAAKQARIQKEAAQEMQYDAIVREKQLIEAQLTPEQEEAQKLADNLANLGSLDSTVQRYVQQAGQVDESAIQTGVEFDLSKFGDGVTDENRDAVEGLLDEVNQLIIDQAPVQDIYNKLATLDDATFLGAGTASTVLSAITSIVDSNPSAAQELTGMAIANQLIDPAEMSIKTLSDAGFLAQDEDGGFSDLGGLNEDELEGILGENWNTLPIESISKIVSSESLREAKQTENINEQLANPNVSTALKELLRDKKRQIEASGMAQIEADADQAAANILSTGSVLFNGRVMPIDTLLSDRGVQAEVDGFFAELSAIAEKEGKTVGELTPEEMANVDLYKNNPQFANVIKNTFSETLEAAESFDEQVEGFQKLNEDINEEIQSETLELKAVPSPETLELFGIVDGSLYAESPDFDNQAWVAAKESPSVIESINGWSDETKEMFKDWMVTTEDQSEVMDILKNPDKAEAFFDAQELSEQLKGMPLKLDKDVGAVLNVLLGNGGQKAVKSAKSIAQVQPEGYGPERMFDAMKIHFGAGVLEGIKIDDETSFGSSPKEIAEAFKRLSNVGDIEKIVELTHRLDKLRTLADKSTQTGTRKTGSGSAARTAKDVRKTIFDRQLFKNGKWQDRAVRSLYTAINLNDLKRSQDAEALLASGQLPHSNRVAREYDKAVRKKIELKHPVPGFPQANDFQKQYERILSETPPAAPTGSLAIGEGATLRAKIWQDKQQRKLNKVKEEAARKFREQNASAISKLQKMIDDPAIPPRMKGALKEQMKKFKWSPKDVTRVGKPKSAEAVKKGAAIIDGLFGG